jgi:hypothetical protein
MSKGKTHYHNSLPKKELGMKNRRLKVLMAALLILGISYIARAQVTNTQSLNEAYQGLVANQDGPVAPAQKNVLSSKKAKPEETGGR